MKFNKLIIASTALLGMVGLSGISANAESTQQANQRAANRILQTEQNAYNHGEISKRDLDANVNNPQLEAQAHGYNSTAEYNTNANVSNRNNAQSTTTPSNNTNKAQYTSNTLPQTGENTEIPLILASLFSMTGLGFILLDLLLEHNRKYISTLTKSPTNTLTNISDNDIKLECDNLIKDMLLNNISK